MHKLIGWNILDFCMRNLRQFTVRISIFLQQTITDLRFHCFVFIAWTCFLQLASQFESLVST